jgi:hypothetical protein
MTNASTTLNGGATNASSLNPVVDLFFQIGAMRGWEESNIVSTFVSALEHNPEQALKVLFWARDIRQGTGERRTFRTVCQHLADTYPEVMSSLIPLIPEYGRWDDLLVFISADRNPAPCEEAALSVISSALRSGDALCAKWMPREKSSKGAIARKIRKYMGLSPKAYRKLLANFTKVVESQMCSGDWDGIEYGHVPSQAMRIYKGAFKRHSEERWASYEQGLAAGTEKVNAGAIYPHEIIGSYISEYSETAIPPVSEAQWSALPNWLMNNPYRILPVVDTSGSMYGGYGMETSVKPIQVSVSLGLYVAERNNGPFKNCFVTFSEKPTMQIVRGDTLSERVYSVSSAKWGMSTNLNGTFDVILSHAKRNRVMQNDMPNVILILSDMEFNQGVDPNSTSMEHIRTAYSAAGYEVPKIVFWNLNARTGNVPVTFREDGTALVSGFSPAIMKSLLAGRDFTPEGIMMETIGGERYAAVSSAIAA